MKFSYLENTNKIYLDCLGARNKITLYFTSSAIGVFFVIVLLLMFKNPR